MLESLWTHCMHTCGCVLSAWSHGLGQSTHWSRGEVKCLLAVLHRLRIWLARLSQILDYNKWLLHWDSQERCAFSAWAVCGGHEEFWLCLSGCGVGILRQRPLAVHLQGIEVRVSVCFNSQSVALEVRSVLETQSSSSECPSLESSCSCTREKKKECCEYQAHGQLAVCSDEPECARGCPPTASDLHGTHTWLLIHFQFKRQNFYFWLLVRLQSLPYVLSA